MLDFAQLWNRAGRQLEAHAYDAALTTLALVAAIARDDDERASVARLVADVERAREARCAGEQRAAAIGHELCRFFVDGLPALRLPLAGQIEMLACAMTLLSAPATQDLGRGAPRRDLLVGVLLAAFGTGSLAKALGYLRASGAETVCHATPCIAAAIAWLSGRGLAMASRRWALPDSPIAALVLTCPHCQRFCDVEGERAGTTVRCPECAAAIAVRAHPAPPDRLRLVRTLDPGLVDTALRDKTLACLADEVSQKLLT